MSWGIDNYDPDGYDGFDDDDETEWCDACDEFGMYVVCPDDLCQSGCIHGDGEIVCPYCKGRGKI